MYKQIKLTLYNTNIKQSGNCYGNVQLQGTEKNETPFLSNNLAEAVAGINTDIKAALQKRVAVICWLISPVSLVKCHQQSNCLIHVNELPTSFFSAVVPEAEVGSSHSENRLSTLVARMNQRKHWHCFLATYLQFY